MKKPSNHVIDEEAVEVFKSSLPKDRWTVYDIKPDYGKDHKVELVEGDEQTGLTFWVQVKGQKKIKPLKDGSISFKLETKDLDYHKRLQVPMFLVVVDVTKRVGYWVFMQEYERTWLKNVSWKNQDHIQIRLPASNRLSDLGRFREAVRNSFRHMVRANFDADIGEEQRRLEGIDPRFKVRITAGTQGRHYSFHSDEVIPVEFTYKNNYAGSGKIEDMIDRGVPIVFKKGEIQVKGSPLFDFFSELAGDRDMQLQASRTVDGSMSLMRTDETGVVTARIDAIPCKIICGRKEARIEADLPLNLLAVRTTIAYNQPSTRSLSMPIDLSAWRGRHLMDLPHFERLSGLLSGLGREERLAFECFAPGERIVNGMMNFEEEKPYSDILLLIEMLSKARAIAALRSLNPILIDGYWSGENLSNIQLLHEILLGEGRRRRTPDTTVRVTIEREGLQDFLSEVRDSSSGTLNLSGDGTFPFFEESVQIEALEREVTEVRSRWDRQSLLDELERSPEKESFQLVWEGTEATETILRVRRAGGVQIAMGASKAA